MILQTTKNERKHLGKHPTQFWVIYSSDVIIYKVIHFVFVVKVMFDVWKFNEFIDVTGKSIFFKNFGYSQTDCTNSLFFYH